VNSITTEERGRIVSLLKDLRVTVTGLGISASADAALGSIGATVGEPGKRMLD
jgi:hypothetical protein